MGSLLKEETPPGLVKVGAGLNLQGAVPSALATRRVSLDKEGGSKSAVVCGSGATMGSRILWGLELLTTRVGGHNKSTGRPAVGGTDKVDTPTLASLIWKALPTRSS